MATAEQVVERNMTAFNAKDMDKLLSNQAPNVEVSGPGGVIVRGRDQVREPVQALWNAFPSQLRIGLRLFHVCPNLSDAGPIRWRRSNLRIAVAETA
jgi:ketosteroid isomerase-like protein